MFVCIQAKDRSHFPFIPIHLFNPNALFQMLVLVLHTLSLLFLIGQFLLEQFQLLVILVDAKLLLDRVDFINNRQNLI